MMATAERKHTNLKVVDNVGVITLDSPGTKVRFCYFIAIQIYNVAATVKYLISIVYNFILWNFIRFIVQQVNSLGPEVMAEFDSVLHEIEGNPQIHAAVLISGKPNCFIAGADIGMLEKCKSMQDATNVSKTGQQILGAIESSKKPIVAAIQGSCLGGGLEVALSCHYRIAVKDKKTGLGKNENFQRFPEKKTQNRLMIPGLPEVMLGLLPGAGGTQRLPQLTTVPNVLDMVLTGKTVKADRAKKFGIVDMLVDPLGPGLAPPEVRTRQYLEEVAVGVAKQLASGKLKPDRAKKSLMDKILTFALQYTWVKDKIFDKARKQVLKMSGGLYPAPLKVKKKIIKKNVSVILYFFRY